MSKPRKSSDHLDPADFRLMLADLPKPEQPKPPTKPKAEKPPKPQS